MKIEDLSEEEILDRLEQGLIDYLPANLAMRVADYCFDRGYTIALDDDR